MPSPPGKDTMKTGPLRLRQLFIDRILIEAGDENAPMELEPEVRIEPGPLRRSKEEPQHWRVELSLKLGPDLDPPAPYVVEMSLSGTFELEQRDLDDDSAARLVAINGLSILYTAAREHIWCQTSRGRWGALGLPTVNFLGMAVDATSRNSSPVLSQGVD